MCFSMSVAMSVQHVCRVKWKQNQKVKEKEVRKNLYDYMHTQKQEEYVLILSFKTSVSSSSDETKWYLISSEAK